MCLCNVSHKNIQIGSQNKLTSDSHDAFETVIQQTPCQFVDRYISTHQRKKTNILTEIAEMYAAV